MIIITCALSHCECSYLYTVHIVTSSSIVSRYLKLADFGFAKDLKGKRSYSLCGTPEYTAPEVYKRAGHGTGVDWWALGNLGHEKLWLMSWVCLNISHSLLVYCQVCFCTRCHPASLPFT